MPFTPAHPAILIPFFRWRYASATGLVAGSMAPDFEYFLRMSVEGEYGHTIEGSFCFDLPVALAISWIFHQLVKESFIRNLPAFFQTRFSCALLFDFKSFLKEHFLIFLLSAWVGVMSHIFWDGFTHNDGYFARHLSIYKGTSIPFLGVNYPLFYALQQISTYVGLAAIFIYICFLPHRVQTQKAKPSFYYWMWIMLITFIVTGIRFSIRNDDFSLGCVVVVNITGFCMGLIITAAAEARFNFKH
jgi:hypothetical protein